MVKVDVVCNKCGNIMEFDDEVIHYESYKHQSFTVKDLQKAIEAICSGCKHYGYDKDCKTFDCPRQVDASVKLLKNNAYEKSLKEQKTPTDY